MRCRLLPLGGPEHRCLLYPQPDVQARSDQHNADQERDSPPVVEERLAGGPEGEAGDQEVALDSATAIAGPSCGNIALSITSTRGYLLPVASRWVPWGGEPPVAASYLERSRIVAPLGWSRWLIPPVALSIHLAIDQAYAWSVFKKPLETSLGISGVDSALPFTLGIVMLACPQRCSAPRSTATARAGPWSSRSIRGSTSRRPSRLRERR